MLLDMKHIMGRLRNALQTKPNPSITPSAVFEVQPKGQAKVVDLVPRLGLSQCTRYIVERRNKAAQHAG